MTREEILSVIRNNLYAVSPEMEAKDLEKITSIKELGLDSLEIIEIISCSMKQLQIKIPRPELMQVQNFEELLDIFVKYANQKTHETTTESQ